MINRIPFNPIAFIEKKISRKKGKKSYKNSFNNILNQQNSAPSSPTQSGNHTDSPQSIPEHQQTLVRHLLRVNELKDNSQKKDNHPARKYHDTQNTVKTFLLSSIGTKQQRNIEVIISDDNHTQPKDK